MVFVKIDWISGRNTVSSIAKQEHRGRGREELERVGGALLFVRACPLYGRLEREARGREGVLAHRRICT